jgi:HAD domain in Swiss Army Knife RNA repair proteins
MSRNPSPTNLNAPLLFVDIDGVISLFGFDHDARPDGAFASIDGIPHFLSAGAAGRLAQLEERFELVWCSGWEEKANEYLPHLLGLPGELPYLTFDGAARFGTAHWKLGPIDAYAGPDRAVAWIDDSFDDSCRDWATARPAPTLLVQTDPGVGMTDHEVEWLLAWAASLPRRRPVTN